MTRAQYEKIFKTGIEIHIPANDLPALREAWNNNIDSLVKEGTLPDRARDWSHPRRFYRYGSKENPKRKAGRKPAKIKTIDITALEWFDKAAGNSYFAATVSIDYGMPTAQSFTLPFQYGYGDQYRHMAAKELVKRGLINLDDRTPLWQYCQDHGITLRHTKHEGCKKRELIALAA